jgi:glutaredoxin
MAATKVILYTSERCGLCDRAKWVLERLEVPYEEILVADDHPYRLRTPVVERNGVVVDEGEIDRASLQKALKRRS